MERRLVSLLGTSAKHVLTAMRRAFYAIAITGLVTAVVVGLAVLVIGEYLTGWKFPPLGPTYLAAAALALAFGYAVAITVALGEILRAIIKTIELIVEESEKLAVAAAKEGEVLLREGAGEAIRLGRGAITEAGTLGRATAGEVGALGRGALNEAGTLGRDVAGAVGGVVGGVGSAIGGVGSAVGREARAVESHLPGHHNAGQTGGASASTPTQTESR